MILRGRLRIWGAMIVLVFIAVFCVLGPLTAWLTRTFWTPHPEYPLTPLETTTLTSYWRDAELSASPLMLSIPFQVASDAPDTRAESVTVENTSSAPVHNIWFYRDGMPNFYDAVALVQSVTDGMQTETEKVLALWELFRAYYYNYIPLATDGLQLDPSALLAVLGTAQCNDAASVLATLCEIAGCDTRLIGIELQSDHGCIAHCVMEVNADGRWIYMDPDGHAIYRRADGNWACAADLVRDASPVRNSPHAYYNPALLAEAFEHGSVAYLESIAGPFSLARRQTDPASYSIFHHLMRYDLLPGAKTTLYPHRMDRAFSRKPPLYCNGELCWSYRPQDFVNGICRGLFAENLSCGTRNDALILTPSQPGKPATLVIPFTSPYLMVGARVAGVIETKDRSARQKVSLFALPFSRCRQPDPATYGWRAISAPNGAFDCSFDEMFQREVLFGYALKIEIPPAGAIVRSLEVVNHLQAAPRALTHLAPGENHLVLYSEMPAAPLFVENSVAGDKSVVFSNGLRITFSPGREGSSLTAPISLSRAPDMRPDARSALACAPD